MVRGIPKAYVVMDPDAKEELCTSAEAMAFVRMVADAGAAAARDTVQVGKTGHEQESVVSSGPEVADGDDGDPVATAYFGTTSHEWHFDEYGTARQPARAPFRAAAERIGLDFKDPGEGETV